MKTPNRARIAIFTPIATIAALAAAPVSANAAGEERSESVSYADLNVATPDGQAELQKRLDAAAWRVCRYDSRGQIVTPRVEHACFRAARQTARIQFAQVVGEERRGG